MDPFDTLGLPPRLDLDPKELEARYRELQRALHPDKYVHAQASERRASLSHAVSVNEAYRTLKDELRRAEALFVRLGGVLEKHGGGQDPELLMEVMELREKLAEAKGERNVDAIESLAREVQAAEGVARTALARSFEALASVPSASQLGKASALLSRLRYYRRFQEEVAQLEEDLLG
jgi:molecular chaperone HscB